MFNLSWFAIVNSWHYLFFIACRGRLQFVSKQQGRQHKKSLLTNLKRQKPPLSWLHHNQQKSRTNTLSLHACLCASCVPPLPIVQVARGEEALLGSEDTDAAPTAGSQGKAPLLPYQCWSFICKLPCCCTMERTLSSSVKWIVCCSSHAWQQHLILRGGRVFWQIHEVQEAWGNQDHIPAAAALSIVQHHWLQSWWEESAG